MFHNYFTNARPLTIRSLGKNSRISSPKKGLFGKISSKDPHDAPGDTGKTFLNSIILATIKSQNNIALAIVSSGIAATLLDGGRTAHSALKLPLNMQNYKNNQWVSERAIDVKNIDVNLINCTIQNEMPDEETTYKSIDTVVNHDESVNYRIEFLNSLHLPGVPPHILSLKIVPQSSFNEI
ncbi:ATP-dependent DNA helicase [Trichonephila clavipes]|nr:ATP-dependent DNA helicase [Trichonephila clavipes]